MYVHRFFVAELDFEAMIEDSDASLNFSYSTPRNSKSEQKFNKWTFTITTQLSSASAQLS